MSVTTKADEELNCAARHVRAALEAMHNAGNSWGFSDYTTEYREKLRSARFDLEGVLIALDRAEG